MCTKSLIQTKHMFQHDFCAGEEPSKINPSGSANQSENYAERSTWDRIYTIKGNCKLYISSPFPLFDLQHFLSLLAHLWWMYILAFFPWLLGTSVCIWIWQPFLVLFVNHFSFLFLVHRQCEIRCSEEC